MIIIDQCKRKSDITAAPETLVNMIFARWDLGCGKVQTEEVRPEANNDFQQVSGRKPAELFRVLSEVDQQVAFPSRPTGKRPMYITDRSVPGTLTPSSVNGIKAERSRGDSHGIEGLPAPNMLGARSRSHE